ncbi:uncharacterized protein LOC114721636 [Neltuma alba]|uniref:uncharacterized protein LOC114721636 n=1 Tax=Neltuma alba TaxID=207710 RepID=UPI0010A56FFB|nr:uncharacterized protein LOC114721636 [Prosopis alba]
MIITGSDETEISVLRNNLSLRFDMKNLGEVNYFLGLEVEKTSQGYFVSQRAYAGNLLERFGIGVAKEKATPMKPNLKLKKDEGKLLKNPIRFRQLVGSLIYLTITRPEISYSVGIVSQFIQNPRAPHLEAAKWILRYTKGTLSYGLLYKKQVKFTLSGFTDADWAGDKNDRHSTSGHCFTVGSAVVSWCNKKQDIVALPSTEAETKHIEVRHHFIREKVLNEEIELTGVRTGAQAAYIFTKALVKPKFQSLRKALGITDRKLARRGSVES